MRSSIEPRNYRFGAVFIPVSWVAEQFFCELKLEHTLSLGRTVTDDMQRGIEIHEEVLEMQEVSTDELLQLIRKRRSFIASFPLIGYVNNLLLIGIPDAIYFKRGKPRYVIELKTTRSILRVWREQVVQAMLYGLLLEEMGFKTEKLQLLILKLRHGENISENERENLINALIRYAERDKLEKLEEKLSNNARVYVIDYSREEALEVVRWASGYWLMQRDAIPTRKPGKCKACEFNATCPRSLVLPGP